MAQAAALRLCRHCVLTVNGAGKSTLAKLVLGLYQAQDGHVVVDDIDYGDVLPESLRDGVSAVFQDYFKFEFTAQESIGIGRVGACEDLAAVKRAARMGRADAVVDSLPRGYQTPIGHVLEGGTGLSEGQWQRIALARAFMRAPQVLVLDEPAASLDPVAEMELYEQFLAAAADHAVIVVTHRLGSARLADRIVVLDCGRILEDGTHEALVAVGGLYARMWEEQSQWYR